VSCAFIITDATGFDTKYLTQCKIIILKRIL